MKRVVIIKDWNDMRCIIIDKAFRMSSSVLVSNLQ